MPTATGGLFITWPSSCLMNCRSQGRHLLIQLMGVRVREMGSGSHDITGVAGITGNSDAVRHVCISSLRA